MSLCLVFGLFLIGLFFLLKNLTKANKNEKYPYSNPTLFYPVKTVIFYLMMKLKQRGHNKNSPTSGGYGVASHNDPALMEYPMPLPSNIKGIDAIFFSGSSMDGWGVVLAMERRPKGLSSVLAYLKVPGKGVLVPLQHPDAVNFRKPEHEDVFKAGGLSIHVVKPNKEWKLQYEGKMRPSDDPQGKVYSVKISLIWSSTLPIFNYDSDLDPWSMSKAFAREPWSRTYFENLREHHQTHYEQMGRLQGSTIIDGEERALDFPAFRDHSFGKRRDWSLMHRYYFHHVFLSDGTKGVLGLVCQPSTCTRLVLGHWWSPKGEGVPVTEIDFELADHGEGGTPPTDYAFHFTAGGVRRCVEVKFEKASIHYLGWDWEAKLHEVFVHYRVDGVSGSGICEWEYRNRSGRPESVTSQDPAWAQPLRQEYLTS